MESDWQLLCPTIQAANLYLLESKKFTDVTFVVGDEKEEIEAHKLILMSRSPVFEAMFERWETGKNSKIEVPEVSGKLFRMFLKILYANEFVVTGTEAAEVLYLAHKYNNPDLATKCSDLLKSAIDVKSAIHILQVATRLDQNALQAQAMEFILVNAKLVFEDKGFLEIDTDTLRTILEHDKLNLKELTVFCTTMTWAENKCKVQKIECTVVNIRIVLKDIIHLIRFPLMSSQEFTDEVIGKHKGILTDAETIGIYMHFNTGLQLESKLTMLPFSTNRRSPIVYTVNPYALAGAGIPSSECWQRQRDARNCWNKFRFTPSWNIRVTGIELYKTTGETSRVANNCFSIYLYPTDATGVPIEMEPQSGSSTVLDFKNGVDVSSGVPNVVAIEYKGGLSSIAQSRGDRLTTSVSLKRENESITFTFGDSEARCGQNKYDKGFILNCICHGRIKAIHFILP